MKRKLLLAFCITLSLCAAAQTDSITALLTRLDKALDSSDKYITAHERDINALRSELGGTRVPLERYQLDMRLFRLYSSFQNDSAVAFLNRAVAAAREAGHDELAEYSRTLIVKQLSLTGYYTEGLSELGQIDIRKLGKEYKKDYFIAANHIYGELGNYSFEQRMKTAYYKKCDAYRDSLYVTADGNDEIWYEKRIQQLLNEDRPQEALALSNRQMRLFKPGSREYAMPAYYRHMVYSKLGERDSMVFWLAVSAICDIKNAVRDQASLWTLAGELSRDGDMERAYRYISFAWDSAQKFGTRIRSWQISPLLGNIDRLVQETSQQENRRLTALALSVSLLALLLAGLLFCIVRQRKRIAAARNELSRVNGELSKANSRLHEVNAELTESNVKLHESNRVKEEYIGRFIGLCAQNIDKRDSMRRETVRLLKTRNIDKLMDISRSMADKEKEQSEFYAEFDNAFLSLYPDFIEQFNSLLREEERIQPASPARLNTPMRIYALIRLGIDSSQKISECLHHSLNTIYNYRAKMRNAAIGDRNEFEKQVKELGRIH